MAKNQKHSLEGGYLYGKNDMERNSASKFKRRIYTESGSPNRKSQGDGKSCHKSRKGSDTDTLIQIRHDFKLGRSRETSGDYDRNGNIVGHCGLRDKVETALIEKKNGAICNLTTNDNFSTRGSEHGHRYSEHGIKIASDNLINRDGDTEKKEGFFLKKRQKTRQDQVIHF